MEVPLLAKGNYYTTIIDDDCVMKLEVFDVFDESTPVNVNQINTRAQGSEEFPPGNYTRTVRYTETINASSTNPRTFKAAWQVKFTIYVDSTYPKITYVSGFTELSNFPTTSAPSIKRAQATSSTYAYAKAYAQNTVQTWDGYVRFLNMEYRVFNDDSGKAVVNMRKELRGTP